MKSIIVTAMLTLLCGPARADAVQESPAAAAPDDPDSAFTPDGHCKPGRSSCFELDEDAPQQPGDETALRIMRAVRANLQKLESATPRNGSTMK